MKILLDENIDVAFAEKLEGYDVETVKSMTWTGKENGDLLNFAVKHNFKVFITLDSNLKYQQNLSKFNISIIYLKANDSRLSSLMTLLPKITENLNSLRDQTGTSFIEIN